MTAALVAALRAQAQTLSTLADALEASPHPDQDSSAWVDVCKASPLSKRVTMAAARSGAIAGARKSGRTWVARRAALDAWLSSETPEPDSGKVSYLDRWNRKAGGAR